MSEFPIITKLGGREVVFEKLRAGGGPTTKDAIRMWSARGTIPGDACRELMALVDADDIEYSAADFQLPTPEPVTDLQGAA